MAFSYHWSRSPMHAPCSTRPTHESTPGLWRLARAGLALNMPPATGGWYRTSVLARKLPCRAKGRGRDWRRKANASVKPGGSMATIGYHVSHEQFAPSELLACVQSAERAGFAAAMCSDHFTPWSEQQGQSGFAWSWLGAAMQATNMSFGMVCAPGQRYHPAIIAQAAATLAELFPGRLWCAFGSGQFMNEHITGAGWIGKPERNARLLECVQVIRALWAGETVTLQGQHITVDEAKLYTLPPQPPLLLGAALTPDTARWIAGWADGVITTYKPLEKQREFI